MRRLVDGEKSEELDNFDQTIRPQSLEEYVGQTEIKDNLKVFIKACKMRDEVLDHVLLYGPPGLGKTTLAHIIANEMGTNIKTATEDFVLDIVISNGDGTSRNLRIDLPPFTLVGATTRAGDISAPLRDRFGIVSKLNYYNEDELYQIVKRTSKVLNMPIEDDAAKELAKRSRKTPRLANRLFKRVRDFALVFDSSTIDNEIMKLSLKRLNVDSDGLDQMDTEYLEALITKFNGGPVGAATVATSIGEEVTTIEDVVEPYLLQEGFIKRTPRGRVACEKAYKHLNIEYEVNK